MSHRINLMDNEIIITHASLRCRDNNLICLNIVFKTDSSCPILKNHLDKMVEDYSITYVPKFDIYFIDQWVMLRDYHIVNSLVQFLLNYKNDATLSAGHFLYAIEAVEHFAI